MKQNSFSKEIFSFWVASFAFDLLLIPSILGIFF